MGRRRRGAAAALTLCPAAEALAVKSSVRLRGPKVNTLGARFQYTVSGVATGRANHLYVWEAPSAPACARTSGSAAQAMPFGVACDEAQHQREAPVPGNRPAGEKRERRAPCVYLVNRRAGKTLARAEAAWINLAPPPGASALQPAAVGSRLCLAKKFPDRSVVAQVAASGAKCAASEAVAFGADAAQGAPFTSAGFSCSATPQGAGSPWAAAWRGTYYAYSCAAGAQQVAFNWGTQ